MEIEHFLNCPYCWQSISMILDLSVDKHFYIEDCEVCCHPIVISYTTKENGELNTFEAARLDE